MWLGGNNCPTNGIKGLKPVADDQLLKFTPDGKLVLLGDAGAIPYVTDAPALDLNGLGGFHGMPFARATRAHVGAAIELIERA